MRCGKSNQCHWGNKKRERTHDVRSLGSLGADHVILDRWTTNPNGTATGWLLWWMKAQISTDTILKRASGIYMIQLRRRRRKQSNNKLRRKLRSQNKPKLTENLITKGRSSKMNLITHPKGAQDTQIHRYMETDTQIVQILRYARHRYTHTQTHRDSASSCWAKEFAGDGAEEEASLDACLLMSPSEKLDQVEN